MWKFWTARRAPQGPKDTPLVQFRQGRIFTPGAQSEIFEQILTNPLILFRGAGRTAGTFYALQHPQVHFPPQVGIQSLGGVQAGQVLGQPLIDPSQLDMTGGGEE